VKTNPALGKDAFQQWEWIPSKVEKGCFPSLGNEQFLH